MTITSLTLHNYSRRFLLITASAVALLLVLPTSETLAAPENSKEFNIRSFGATGDGTTLDTEGIRGEGNSLPLSEAGVERADARTTRTGPAWADISQSSNCKGDMNPNFISMVDMKLQPFNLQQVKLLDGLIPFQDLSRNGRDDANGRLATVDDFKSFTIRDLALNLRPVCLHFSDGNHFHNDMNVKCFSNCQTWSPMRHLIE